MMQLDDVVETTHDDPDRFEEARHRTVRWLDRCVHCFYDNIHDIEVEKSGTINACAINFGPTRF